MRKFQRGFVQFIPLIAAGIGAAASHINANKNNRDQEQMTREQMAFNAEEADKSRMFSAGQAQQQMNYQTTQVREARDWSEEMANTQYQRAIGDLSKAGLNPMLAYSQGGAPTPSTSAPSGAMGQSPAASYSNVPQRQNAVQIGLSTAMQAMAASNLDKTGRNIDADTALKQAQTMKETNSATNIEQQTENLKTNIKEMEARIGLMDAQAWHEDDKRLLTNVDIELRKIQKGVASGQIDVNAANVAMTKAETILKQLQVPEAKAYADKFSGGFGKDVTPYLREVLDIMRHLIYGRSATR